MPATIDGKPVYGPPVTPRIFCTNWQRKCNVLLNNLQECLGNRYIEVETDAEIRERLAWEAPLYLRFFDYIIEFDAQTTHLGVTADMLDTTLEEQRATGRKAVYNPFSDMAKARILVSNFVGGAEQAKSYGSAREWVKWQTLPLAQRQLINDLIVRLREKMSKGKWSVDEELHEKWAASAEEGFASGRTQYLLSRTYESRVAPMSD